MAFFEDNVVWMMKKCMQDFDCEVLDAAAIFGNAGLESGGFLSLQEKKPLVKGSRGGYGIFQWTGPRRKNFEAYCARNNLDPTAMETNYKFFFVEMKSEEGKDGKVIARVKAAKTLEAKTEVFMKEFLRPGIPHLDQRIKWAKRALAAYEKEPIVVVPPAAKVNPVIVEHPALPEPIAVEQHPAPAPTIPHKAKGLTVLFSIIAAIIAGIVRYFGG